MTETEWRQRYAARIQQATLCSNEEAKQYAEMVDVEDFDIDEDDPEEAADDEMGYWDDDGDEDDEQDDE